MRIDRWRVEAVTDGLRRVGGHGVGFIALAGVAAEFGMVMLLYLKHAL
jgi:Cu/Ag efflux pump CusA